MNKIIIVLSLFSMMNCCAKKEQINISYKFIKDSLVYEKDKEQIAECFINKVEYFRKYHNYEGEIYSNSPDSIKKKNNEYYSKYAGADIDAANFFEPYATRFNLKRDKYVASPLSTAQQLEVKTDTILYDKNELICFAFLIIKLNYSSIDGFEEVRGEDRRYDARAVIGLRSNKNSPFEIYPVTEYNVIGFEGYKSAIEELKANYFRNLAKIGAPSFGMYQGLKLINVGDNSFFDKSPYFKKTREGLYYFQVHKELNGHVKKYDYNPKCNPG